MMLILNEGKLSEHFLKHGKKYVTGLSVASAGLAAKAGIDKLEDTPAEKAEKKRKAEELQKMKDQLEYDKEHPIEWMAKYSVDKIKEKIKGD